MPDVNTDADSLRLYLTGAGSNGGAQTNPDAALGNYRSSTECQMLGIVVTSPIANVTVGYASGSNGPGDGTLDAPGVDDLTWQAPGSATAGAAVTILDGETKILEDGEDVSKYVRVTRTTTDDLAGTATVTLAEVFNDLVGFDNISSDESSAGDAEYRALMLKNGAAGNITNVKLWIGTLGTQAVSDGGQLGASGSGTISTTGNFDDWPDSGFCHVRTSGGSTREIAYYTSRTSDTLTIPSAGRGRLGTSAAAGASDDTLDSVPGIRIGKEATSSSHVQTIANENTAPTGITWSTSLTAAGGISVGTMASAGLYGIWIHRDVPVGMRAIASDLHLIEISFDA